MADGNHFSLYLDCSYSLLQLPTEGKMSDFIATFDRFLLYSVPILLINTDIQRWFQPLNGKITLPVCPTSGPVVGLVRGLQQCIKIPSFSKLYRVLVLRSGKTRFTSTEKTACPS